MPKIPMDGKAAKRLLGYVWKGHKGQLIAVLICILVSAITGVAGSLFTQRLIDDYITPLLLSPSPVFTGLLQAILMMAVVYLAGTLAAFAYNRIMVSVSQGVLKQIRDGLFARMQALPIRYFDTHSHGDIMSVYTNDTDTLRQAVSQSLPPNVQRRHHRGGRVHRHDNHQHRDGSGAALCGRYAAGQPEGGGKKPPVLHPPAGFSGVAQRIHRRDGSRPESYQGVLS